MLDEYSLIFKQALIDHDISVIKKIPKSDLHNHAMLGGNPDEFNIRFPKYYCGYNGMKNFINKYISPNTNTVSACKKYILSTCERSVLDGIKYLETSIDFRLVDMFQNLDDLIMYLTDLKKLFLKKCNINFDLGLSRKNFFQFEKAKEVLSLSIFSGIDLYGDEYSRSIYEFRKIYEYSKSKNKVCKAHIGEYGSAFKIYEAIKILQLDEVQHGISVINNKSLLNKIRNLNVNFNVSVSSNVKLKIINNYFAHPIKRMYDYGMRVTLNTDDALLFNVGISDDFLKLYSLNIFNEHELDEIRLTGLGRYKK